MREEKGVIYDSREIKRNKNHQDDEKNTLEYITPDEKTNSSVKPDPKKNGQAQNQTSKPKADIKNKQTMEVNAENNAINSEKQHQYKDRNKARFANHNRKAGADRKMNKSAFSIQN